MACVQMQGVPRARQALEECAHLSFLSCWEEPRNVETPLHATVTKEEPTDRAARWKSPRTSIEVLQPLVPRTGWAAGLPVALPPRRCRHLGTRACLIVALRHGAASPHDSAATRLAMAHQLPPIPTQTPMVATMTPDVTFNLVAPRVIAVTSRQHGCAMH